MVIYKYISFEDFVSIIETKRMFLRNIKDWEDPFEGYVPFSKIGDEFLDILNDSMTKYQESADEISIRNSKIEKILFLKLYENHCFAQCWLKEEEESDALWRIYSQGKGVRIAVDNDEIQQKIKKQIETIGWMVEDVFSIEVTYKYIGNCASFVLR